jgi:hypothetical protein
VASNYPGSLDSFDTIASDKKTSDAVGGRTHRQMHNDLGDAIESVQAELGTDPAGSFATVKARLAAYDSYAAKTGAYTATVDDNTLNVTSGTFTLDLPAASTCTGKTLKVKNSGTGVVTLDGNASETIEGVATFPLGKGGYVEITSTGAAWILTGGVPDTGWRNMATSIDSDFAVADSMGFLRMRRQGSRVTLVGRLKRVTASGSQANFSAGVFATLASGFYPPGDGYYSVGTAMIEEAQVAAVAFAVDRATPSVVWPGGGTWAAGDAVWLSVSFLTDESWPTSLPGTAA